MLTIWTNKIKHSTVGSSFSVTFSVAPNESEYLDKLYDCFSSMNWSSFPITADRKTENSSEKPNNCETCKYESLASYEGACDDCTDISGSPSNYEPKSEPTTEDSSTVDWKDQMWKEAVKTEPQTDCKVCLYRNIPKDSPHCMSCKNNSKFERDWSAEPQTERSSE